MKRVHDMAMIAVLCAALSAGNALAQSANQAGDDGQSGNGAGDDSATRMHAVRLEDTEIELDGRLDDPAWQEARFATGFQQRAARRGWPVADETEVAFLYDDRALYVAARMYASDPGVIRAPRSQRDDVANADRIIVSLDTYRNRETAYNFGVTAGGSRIDYYQPVDDFMVRDYSYDPVWEARVAMDEAGWTAEMRIPFASLEFNAADELVWGVNVQRVSPGERMYAFWVVVPGNDPGWASRFGELVGLNDVPPPQQIALTPYVSAQKVVSDLRPATDELVTAATDEARFSIGGDAIYEITPSLALEATINPDFGQIEADPAVVNLTAFETFFPEKRPFFLRGNQLLEGQGPRYYYSRRIGGRPHGAIEGPLEEQPLGTTILGAGKLIGRLPSGWSVGSLLAVTDDEEALFLDPETEATSSVRIEPQTIYGTGRVQKDLGAGSTFGVVGTAVHRSLDDGEPLSAIVADQAYSGGADFNLRVAEGSHQIGGYLGGSTVRGDPLAILRLQASSARYYQRPDAGYVELDPGRTSLSGYTGGIHVGRIEGPWHWTVSGDARSPGFEINDAGALNTADDADGFAQVGYGGPVSPGPWRRVDASLALGSGWNFGGIRQYTTPEVDLNFVWGNFWRSYVRVARDAPALSDSLTRGGPLMRTAARWRSRFGFSTNEARQHVWAVDAGYSADELGSWGYELSTRLSLRLNDHLWLSVIPGVDQGREERQFFTQVENGRPETFGRRYVFASLEQTTLFTRVRARLDITPRLGIELYAEPFLASGDFDDFGELAAPRTNELRVYGVAEDTTITPLPDGSNVVTDGDDAFALANSDFDLESLRSNLVMRWDYRQGSTLWLVWQQNRLVEGTSGAPPTVNDLTDLFTAPSENILAVKLSFRLDLR